MSIFELTRYQWIKRLLYNRWPQFLLRAIMLAGLFFTILTGLFGTPVGSHNFAIIFVWIAWWTALKLVFIPIGGRSWCSICPIPLPGEWLQKGGILKPGKHRIGLNKRWPKWIRGNWLQAGGFLLIGLFGAVTLTSSRVTAWVLVGVFLLAAGLSLIFERRSFCNYLCPIGGFSGLYARLAPTELRVKDRPTCIAHKEKTCYINCPWGVYPFALKNNSPCGLCLECMRACPYDNIAVNLRAFGSDLNEKNDLRMDEVFLGLVMLSSALVFSAVFLGPWGSIKSAAYTVGSGEWFIYAAVFLSIAVILMPALFLVSVWLGNRMVGETAKLRQNIAAQGQLLIPLGLTTWIAFTVSFALAKFRYVLPVLADPFGWGWHIFDVHSVSVAVSNASFGPLVEALILAVGLFWVGSVIRKNNTLIRSVPVLILCLGYVIGMLWLLVG